MLYIVPLVAVYYNLTPTKTEGLSGRPYKAALTRKVRNMLRLAAVDGVVACFGPPATGKTSLMQQMSAEARAQGWGAVYELSAIRGLQPVSVDGLIREASRGKLSWNELWGQPSPNSSEGGVQLSGMMLVLLI